MNHEPHELHEPGEPLLYADEVFAIQGAIFEVDRHMGTGFLEAVYQESLAIEFAFVTARAPGLTYKGRPLRQPYQADFVCFDQIIVELKAVRELAPEHRAQVF